LGDVPKFGDFGKNYQEKPGYDKVIAKRKWFGFFTHMVK